MTYDAGCYDLANNAMDRLRDDDVLVEDKQIEKLAQTIQAAIEQFLSDLESDRQQELEAAKDAAIDRKMDEQRGPDRDEWKHEAAEWQRLK